MQLSCWAAHRRAARQHVQLCAGARVLVGQQVRGEILRISQPLLLPAIVPPRELRAHVLREQPPLAVAAAVVAAVVAAAAAA